MTRRAVAAALAAALLLLGAGPALAAGAPAQATWHADQARVPEARALGGGGAGVLVAVLDSWVDASHRDFEGRVLPGADCTSGTCVDGPPAADPCDHGTHVAGTVAASSYGVAPAATVLPVKVLAYDASADPPACNGTVNGVAAGLRWAVARGARVVNLSLGALVPGLSSSPEITAAVDEAVALGAVVVFAAGSASVPVTDAYGGGAVIVAATGPDGAVADYSQRGDGVTLAAPGGSPDGSASCSPTSCVTSLFPGDRYAVAAGTSMAAPHVAGVAALLLAQDPSRTRDQVVATLRATASPVPGGGAGDGLVDATAALRVKAVGAPARPSTAAPASAASAPPAPGALAVEPEPLPGSEPPAAPEQAAPAPPGGSAPVRRADEDLPPGPAALAAALVLAAAVSTALAHGHR
jgi:subtilisin family serine protease